MKKLILAVLAVAAIATTGCSKKDAAADGAPMVDRATSDSISEFYGRTIGSYVLADFQRFDAEHQTQQTKDDIFKGIRLVMGAEPSEGTLMGIQIGSQLMGELNRMREQGIEIDNATVLKYFKQSFDADSLDMTRVQEYSRTLNDLMTGVQRKAQEREEAARAAAPDASDNVAAGEAYVNNLKASDPEIKTSESGLSYKIINKGDDTEINDNSIVAVNYVGKLINGTVFDQSTDGEPATFSPSGVIPGFREGLKMLGKGGKAVLYIPGNLAYGPQGVPQANIGPNEMLVFEIEIADVK